MSQSRTQNFFVRKKECWLILKHSEIPLLCLYLVPPTHTFFFNPARDSEQVSNSPWNPLEALPDTSTHCGTVPAEAAFRVLMGRPFFECFFSSTYMCSSEGKGCLRFVKMMNVSPIISLRKWQKSSTTPESTPSSTSQCSPPLTVYSWTWRESTAWPTSNELWIFSRRSKSAST